MTLIDLIDCVRITFAFLVLFGGVPWFILQIWPGDRNLVRFCAMAVRTSLFAAIAALILGSIRICLPGSMLIAYLSLFVLVAWIGGRLESLRQPHTRAALVRRIFLCVDNRHNSLQRVRPASEGFRHWQVLRTSAFVFSTSVAAVTLSQSLHFVRFLNDESYSRALSLQKLALGQPWAPDGAAALLAPVAFFASLDGATVVRFSSPLFIAVLALAGFALIRARTGSSPMGLIAAAALVLLTAFSHSGEIQAGGIALIFWIIGFELWIGRHRWDASWSFVLGLLIEPIPERTALLCISVLLLAVFLARFVKVTPLDQPIAILLAVVAVISLILVPQYRERTHSTQYNIAARTVLRIIREFPRNAWLVISPVQEVALTYGNGWHMELSEFVHKYTVDQVRRHDFSFRFPVDDTFVFVEKQPRAPRAMATGLSELGPRFDPLMAPYQLRLNRASMQFQAARLLAAYRATHGGIEVFLEDQHLIVYRIRRVSPFV